MNTFVRFLLIIYLVLRSESTNVTPADQFLEQHQPVEVIKSEKSDLGQLVTTTKETSTVAAGRSFDNADEHYLQVESITERDQHQSFQRKAKPIRNIYLGIYKNYKSTYLGNRTSLEYRKTLKDYRTSTKNAAGTTAEESQPVTSEISDEELNDFNSITLPPPAHEEETTEMPVMPRKTRKNKRKSNKKKRKNKSKHKKKKKGSIVPKPPAGDGDPLIYSNNGEYRYNIGPGINMSLDTNNDIVSVNLDEDSLKDIFSSRWNDNDEGRGKKQELISKVLPLFIIPFLIQSAIIPFLVTKLKLLLIKSILVGKLAIFLLVISAFKNSSKSMQTYEVAPSYWAGEPSRRSEAVVAAPSPYSGYRVEGRPTTWVNR